MTPNLNILIAGKKLHDSPPTHLVTWFLHVDRKIHGLKTSAKIKSFKQKENVKMQLQMFDVETFSQFVLRNLFKTPLF